MEQGYLVDTNTVIDYLENKLPEESPKIIDNIEIQFSVISRIELLVWKKATDKQLEILNDFIKASVVFSLDEKTVLKSIEIRRTYGLKLPDAIIASTAIVNDLILLSRNTVDFKKITALKCVNPYQL